MAELHKFVSKADVSARKIALDIGNLVRQREDFHTRLQQLHGSLELSYEEKKVLGALRENEQQFQTALAEAQSHTRSLEAEVAQLEEDILRAGGAKLRAQKARVEELVRAMEAASHSVNKVEVTCQTNTKKIAQAEEKVEESKAEVVAITAKLAALEAERAQLEGDALQVMEAMKIVAAELAEKEAKLQLERELQKLKAKLQRAGAAGAVVGGDAQAEEESQASAAAAGQEQEAEADARAPDRHFGVSLRRVAAVRQGNYKSPIPVILVQMADFLRRKGAFEVQGIFRVSAAKALAGKVKEELDAGTFQGCKDVHAVANLMGQWLAELPEKVFAPVPPEAFKGVADQNAAWAIVQGLPEPNRSVVLWLLDLLVEVAGSSDTNKMTPHNLAIVFSPNLYDIQPSMGMSAKETDEVRAAAVVLLLLLLYSNHPVFIPFCGMVWCGVASPRKCYNAQMLRLIKQVNTSVEYCIHYRARMVN